jgi:DNA-binding transcriptional regulator GbsR (MarR family)
MLREHINDIMTRWSPKERRGSLYDPVMFLETPEQARKLISHLQHELKKARRERNQELVSEVGEILSRVENLSKKFFRWEENMRRSLREEDLREIKKLPLGF